MVGFYIAESEPFTMKATQPSREMESESELQQPRWSVISFDKCEASGLTYEAAAEKMAELEAAKVAGLCIVTDEAAVQMSRGKN